MKRWIAAGLALALPLLAGCDLVPQEEVLPQMPVVQQIEEMVYETTQVMRGDLAQEKIYSCSYQPAEEEKLYFNQKNQAIKAIYVQAGDRVEKGQLIAELDNTSVLKSIENQQYTLDSLNLQIVQQQNYIKTQEERIQVLTELAQKDASYNSRITSAQQSLESRKSQLSLLYAQLSIERGALEELEAQLKSRQLYAGIDGIVSYTLDLGNTTVYTKNQLICNIQNLGEASFVGSFPAGMISLEQEIILRDGDKEMPVVAKSIDAPDEKGNCSVSFKLVVPDASLKAGDSARVTLVNASLTDVLYLPALAVQEKENGAFVYYLDGNGILAVKAVEAGETINGCTHIISGLVEGEVVLAKTP